MVDNQEEFLRQREQFNSLDGRKLLDAIYDKIKTKLVALEFLRIIKLSINYPGSS